MTRNEFKLTNFKEILLKVAEFSVSSTIKVGCMALKKDFSKIASFGYNGSYTGAKISEKSGFEEESLESGHSGFIHAEVNMIAKFKENDPENYIILLTLSPCNMCTKVLINAGFKYVYWIENYRDIDHLKFFTETGVLHGDFNKLLKDYQKIK